MSCVSGRIFPGSGSKSQILDPDPQHYFLFKKKVCLINVRIFEHFQWANV